MRWQLVINDDTSYVSNLGDLREHLARARQSEFLELWLTQDDDDDVDRGAMKLLASGKHAWLMHLRHHDGDSGFSSLNPAYDGSPNATVPFRLSNGQLDIYPLAWMISRERALQAIEHFLLTGDRAPWITWHED